MSKVESIIINFNNLTDKEQLGIIWNFIKWSNEELPDDKNLMVYIVPKGKEKLLKKVRKKQENG